MTKMYFPEWLPDQAAMSGNLAAEARNVRPQARGYGPFPSAITQPNMAYPGERPHGRIYTFKDSQGEVLSFVGDKTDLFVLRASGWELATRLVGPYNTDEKDQWSMVQWGDTVYAVNGTDDMQRFALNGGANFEDVDIGLANTTFGQLIVVGDFLVGLRTKVAGLPRWFRVHWSGLSLPESWTPDPETLADFQDVADIGAILAGAGGEQGLLVAESGAVRMTFTGDQRAMILDTVETSAGCIERNSAVAFKGLVFYLSDDGWLAFDGAQSIPIGNEKIDRWFTRNADRTARYRMIAYVPEDQTLVYIAFAGPGNSGGTPNIILVYDHGVKRWSYVEMTLDSIGLVATAGILMDDIDDFMDDPPYADTLMDSAAFSGGDPFDAIIVGTETRGLQGPPLRAFLDTMEISEQGELLITEVEPLVTGGPCTIQARVGVREKANQQQPTFGPLHSQERTGVISCRDRGRFPRIRLEIEGEWEQAHGVKLSIAGVSKS